MNPYLLADQPAVPAGHRDRAAFVHRDRAITFAELDDAATRFAAAAHAAGLRPGDRVLLLAPNALETFVVLVGCARAGLVTVPVNWRLSPGELAAVAADAGARLVVVDRSLAHLLWAVVDSGVPLLTLGEQFDQWLADAPARRAVVEHRPDDVVLQVYTSGTSGRPKGVLLTNRNLATKVPGVTPRWGLASDSVSLLATPLFHVGALSWGLAGLHAGATTILAGDASPATLLAHLTDDAVSHTFLVPAMIARLCEEAPEGSSFPALRTVLYGASPISAQVQGEALRLFGPVLHQVYGLSETTGSLTEMVPGPDLPADSPLYRSAGQAYPWIELEIRDPGTGERLPANAFGEVWTRSAQNSPGYFGLPEETAELLTPDGWLRTGDGGHLDDEGYLFLTDRVKDLIISGGENVYPAEVETVLREHAAVADVAVFGVPDDRWGEVVSAAVVARTEVTADELIAFTDGRLAGYKRPRTVRIVDDLPRNAAGKVLRRVLRDGALEGSTA
ncbi:AMP-binding protein [Blastococcus sp. PRF04-17]|uniref:AMP-binding protein n=1 Tax=Blastococcus sp. PRF04-17 TaxID=2933797 RepID=UPI001FF403BE|nr:AMP-binding protein [Blastococcus sp. PRF04-17]UOY01810.1 AMP-binding protein [Blastococcus sp. PRF04-17]